MEKEIMYVAPEVQVLSAQVEKGVYNSFNPGENPYPGGEL